MTVSKTLYEEAIADVKKLRELAENQACDRVLRRVEPRIKELVEKQLFGGDEDREEDEEPVGEASMTSSVAGTASPPPEEDRVEEEYELGEGSERALAPLADFASPLNDDRFVAEVYRLDEDVKRMVMAKKADRSDDSFVGRVSSAISKLEDMYVYLRESYAGEDRDALEGKLEKSYGLANAVKESTMKIRDLLLKEETLTMKVNGLPDDVDLDGVTVDIIADEEGVEGSEGTEGDVSSPAGDAGAPPGPPAPPPQMEADEVLEISDVELRAELQRMNEVDAAVLDDFGDASDEGHPVKDKTSDLGSVCDTKKHRAEPKMEAVRAKLARAAKRLSECRGTPREDVARAMYRSVIREYRETKGLLNEGKKVQTAPATKNVADGKGSSEGGKVAELTKRLAESELLNAKLIHANKLLRIEGLTKAQKVMVVDRIDEARNLREVGLISESLSKALAVTKGSSLNESKRSPSGSASRPSKPAGAPQVLEEGLETARWAVLAGIK